MGSSKDLSYQALRLISLDMPKRSPEFQELSEQVGEFIAYWGFKKIHGKIWTNLYTSKTPLDAGTLVKRIHVSKALISISLKELIHYGVVQEAGKSSSGTVLYEANPKVTEVIISVLRKREQKMVCHALAAQLRVEQLSDEEKERLGLCQDRIENLGIMVREANKLLNKLVALKPIHFRLFRTVGDKIRKNSFE
ncbi:MAG: hypothetical protein COT74_12530 [Bdellovibrionales bacterium CG10_big_fil_rev_8_21_14_0_10_45_34]|nr:MAG: hypothetical protein COT74_12530 [Bdellovibrionales bacterium CG10_big_fil_rev_8_21_14_0_10_45_34]